MITFGYYTTLSFANFIFVVFLVFSLVIFIVLVLLVRQIRKDGHLPTEKMNSLVAILFLPSLFVFALSYKSISDWRGEIQQQYNRTEINNFVEKIYSPLATSQTSLLNSFTQMRSLLKNINVLKLTHHNHADLIHQVKEEWSIAQVNLYNAYNNTDKEIRRAWIAHKTMDQDDVLAKFSKQAVQLEESLKKSEKKYEQHIHSSHDKLVKSLDSARKLLNANSRPAKTKKQRLRNKAIRENIRPFNDRLSADLVDYMATINKRLKIETKTLQELIRISGQQAAILKNHLRKNEDLEKPLTIIINKWLNLEKNNRLVLNQIFYAVEAEYVARKLGLAYKSPAISAMHKSLRKNIPAIVGKALQQRRSIDQSYKIKL